MPRALLKRNFNKVHALCFIVPWARSLKPGFQMIVQIVPIVSKNAQTIGTIIYGNATQTNANDPDRFKIYTIVLIVRMELNSIQAIEVVSVVRVVCDRLGSVSI